MSGRSPRVALLGARRVRQGLGPFVARDLVRAGAEVPCFLVTRPESLEPASEGLAEHAGIRPRGYVRLDELLAREELDALAILSPAETHAAHLEVAARRGLHVLCEKPLVWGEPDLASRAAELVAAFEARSLVLFENCQWPYVLPAFERLYPGALGAPPRSFRMELQPAATEGLQALGDSLSHPLSVLQALLPGGEPSLEDVGYSHHTGGPGSLSLRFRYRSDERTCEVAVALSPAAHQPRRAVLEIDGRRARRVVAPETYRLSFVSPDDRRVPLDDPLTRLVADFVEALRAPDAPRTRSARAREIAQRMKLLTELAQAYSREEVA